MPKVKVTITFEYDLEPENYPAGLTIDEMIKIDMDNLENGDTFIHEMTDRVDIKGEEIK